MIVADVTLTLDLHFMLHLECHPDLDLLCWSGAALLRGGKQADEVVGGGGSRGGRWLVGPGCLLTHINYIQEMTSPAEGYVNNDQWRRRSLRS